MAYQFNGTNQFVSTASAPIDGLTYPFSIACWFRPSNITSTGVMVSMAPSSGNYWSIVAAGGIAGDPVAAYHSSETVAVRAGLSTSGYTANVWNHGCAVFSESNSRTAYLSGGSAGTNTTSEGSVLAATEINVAARRLTGVLGTYFNGQIAEVGIWNVALTAEEIASLADGMTCDKVRPQSLVFYAPLVRDLIDAKGGLTITNNNTATVANHPRVYA
jgi:hypothetical protein